tara:strand:+ start:4383 stop:4718 length:336 start_codon:yes stop_codon:yes gene_type:complete
MSETFVSSSGEVQKFINGHLVKDIGFAAQYDGDIADIQLRHNDQEYYTQLDNATLMELLNASRNHDSLIVRLQKDFPLVTENNSVSMRETKNKKSKKKNYKKKSKKKRHKK